MRDHHVDFIGIMETKKKNISPSFLRNLTNNMPFCWLQLDPVGSTGGILPGANTDLFNVVARESRTFSTSAIMTNKKDGPCWKLIVIYGPAYEDRKLEFLEELDSIMDLWHGPVMLGADFNLVRFTSDKNTGIINHRWADLFNSWIDKWGLIELNPSNKRFTWTNNQDQVIMNKIDRIFVSTSWEAHYPLTRVKAVDRVPSDHNPLILDTERILQ